MLTLSITLGIVLSYVVMLFVVLQPKVMELYMKYVFKCMEQVANIDYTEKIKEDEES
jgi:hypothetical protein